MKSNSQIAAEILIQILATGVKNFIICAGARNAPLVVPLLKLDGHKDVKIWHHFDERAAAFFALGLSKQKLEPVCVVTTSGTAVAELLPATIEAYYSAIPLILLTADRPDRFHGSGAPQAIEQVGIFGPYATTQINTWNHAAPLHLNINFEEPLFDGDEDNIEIKPPPQPTPPDIVKNSIPNLPTIVLVGELTKTEQPAVAKFLRETNLPAWCEATSGLREADSINHIRHGDLAIPTIEITSILRIGGVPSLRFWRDLETRPEISVASISRTGFSGLARKKGVTIQQGMLDDSIGYDREAIKRNTILPSEPVPFSNSEEQAIHDLSKRIPADALVFLGNSLPIREWNSVATTETPHPHTFANRGANGIDGEISTFLGLCQDFEGEECWGIFGDLTTLYDLNAPWIVDQLDKEKRIRIVVVNNGGGKIFSKLPGLKDLPDEKKQVTENWHGFDFTKWAELWNTVEIEVLDVR